MNKAVKTPTFKQMTTSHKIQTMIFLFYSFSKSHISSNVDNVKHGNDPHEIKKMDQ